MARSALSVSFSRKRPAGLDGDFVIGGTTGTKHSKSYPIIGVMDRLVQFTVTANHIWFPDLATRHGPAAGRDRSPLLAVDDIASSRHFSIGMPPRRALARSPIFAPACNCRGAINSAVPRQALKQAARFGHPSSANPAAAIVKPLTIGRSPSFYKSPVLCLRIQGFFHVFSSKRTNTAAGAVSDTVFLEMIATLYGTLMPMCSRK